MVFDDPKNLRPRRSPRLPGLDYTAANVYFVTVCTHRKQCIFGLPDAPTVLGSAAAQGIREIPAHFPGVRVDKWVVMPNHIHMMLLTPHAKYNLADIIGSYKSYVSKCAHQTHPHCTVWQRSYYDRVVRDKVSYLEFWQYIDNNPAKWLLDEYHP